MKLEGKVWKYGDNIDTDVIIPARYLVTTDPKTLAAHCMEDIDQAFASQVEPGDIIVGGRNFGCGSSREHAVWAVQQAGYRALIAPVKGEGFADIFEGNAYNNGLLPIELPEADWLAIAEVSRSDPSLEATIDLKAGTIALHPSAGGDGPEIPFQVSEADRHRLLLGLDAIGETLQHDAAIGDYENRAPAWASSPGA